MSNTKQIGLGILQYTQDYDEKLPPSYNTGISGEQAFWNLAIQPYVKSTQLFFCPSDTLADSSKPFTHNNISYGYNYIYLNAAPFYTGGGISLASIGSVSETVMLGDSNATGTRYVIAWDPTLTYQPRPLHLEGANICFVDGHSKWFKVPGVITKDATLWDLQ